MSCVTLWVHLVDNTHLYAFFTNLRRQKIYKTLQHSPLTITTISYIFEDRYFGDAPSCKLSSHIHKSIIACDETWTYTFPISIRPNGTYSLKDLNYNRIKPPHIPSSNHCMYQISSHVTFYISKTKLTFCGIRFQLIKKEIRWRS